MNHDAELILVGALISFIAFLFVHLWRCTVIEERFEKRFDDSATYWHTENRKLSALNESLEMALNSALRVTSAVQSDTTKEQTK
jgi:hypothetical protein